MNYTVESIQETISQINGFTDRIAAIEKEVSFELRAIRMFERKIEDLEEEIEKRLAKPDDYQIGAGAGTVDECKDRLSTGKEGLSKVKADYAQDTFALDDLTEDFDQFLLIVSENYDVNKLVDMRREIGKEMSKQFRLQKESYELQKQRYETCKSKGKFTTADREFIDEHKQKSQQHKNKWIKLCDDREIICKLVSVLDPADQDLGFDEQEDV